MKATLIATACVAATLIVMGTAFGQDSAVSAVPISSPPTFYHHASTWEEGMLRGGGDMLRAAGEMNYNNSLAAIYGQEAYSRYLDNRLKVASTYFDLRELNREARAEERGQRATPEDLKEYAKVRAPDRLAAHQLDPTTRRLLWPASLEGANFAADRAEIDRLIEARRSSAENLEVQTLAASMKEKLITQVRLMKPDEYLAAKRFLTSLEYEMKFAAGPATTVAVR